MGKKDPTAIPGPCSDLSNPAGPPSVVLFCLLWGEAKRWVTLKASLLLGLLEHTCLQEISTADLAWASSCSAKSGVIRSMHSFQVLLCFQKQGGSPDGGDLCSLSLSVRSFACGRTRTVTRHTYTMTLWPETGLGIISQGTHER